MLDFCGLNLPQAIVLASIGLKGKACWKQSLQGLLCLAQPGLQQFLLLATLSSFLRRLIHGFLALIRHNVGKLFANKWVVEICLLLKKILCLLCGNPKNKTS